MRIEYTVGGEEEVDAAVRSLSVGECLIAGRLESVTQRAFVTGASAACFTSKLVSIKRGEHVEWELLAQDGAPLTLIGPCNTNARTDVRLSDLLDSDTGAVIGTAVVLGYQFSRVRGRFCSFGTPDATEQFKESLADCGRNCSSKRPSAHPDTPDAQ